jgi:hypothetical protein
MMSEAASQAASGTGSDEIEQALDYLRLLWGDEFLIGHDAEGYWSTRHGDVGGPIMRADDPEKLGELMNDYPGTAR